MSYDSYTLLDITVDDAVVTASVNAGPMNLITPTLLGELRAVAAEVAKDPNPLVFVIKSSNPDFFIGHAKFGEVNRDDESPVIVTREPDGLNIVHSLCETLRTMDKVTVAQVEGRATGGGAGITMACDLRYAAIGRAVFNSFGVSIASGMGGGGSQYMPRHVGISRAMELILAGLDLDAETAERWGYVTRALTADSIEDYVSRIVSRIASSAPDVIRETKRLIGLTSDHSIRDGLKAEASTMDGLKGSAETRLSMRDFLEFGGETIEGEQRVEALLGEVLAKRVRRAH